MKKFILTLFAFLSLSLSAIAGVNINTATESELQTLDGIGPVKAKSIIDYRKKHGEFKSVDELENVDGIGASTLKNLRKDVALTGKTTVKAVGNEKAASSGKKADSKEVKIEESSKAKPTKSPKSADKPAK